MKAILNCPFIPIASRVASHRGAQGAIYADMIRQSGYEVDVNWSGKIEDHNKYDVMFVYHGNDWQGTVNIFGGVQGFPYAFNTRNFSKFKGQVYSLAVDFPPYHEFIRDRIQGAKARDVDIQQEFLDVDLANLERMYKTAITVKYPFITDKVVIGDSHSICMYRPGWTVNSVPFKTLHGALKTGLQKFVEDVTPLQDVNAVECYFGNIDIRHHVCRIGNDYKKNVDVLVGEYVRQVEALPVKDVAIYELLPIEDESRKLPKSGYFEGKPFWGSWAQRNEARLYFREKLEETVTRAKVIRWTDYLLNKYGQLDFEHMEKPKSIHLSRGSYPHWQGESAKETSSLEDFFE